MKYFSLLLFLLIGINHQLNAQTADLIITKTGLSSTTQGATITYVITMLNNGPNAADNATFNDVLPAGVTNPIFVSCSTTNGAACPTYTMGSTNVSGTIPTFPIDGTVTFTFSVTAPLANTVSSLTNTVTIATPSGVTEIDPSTNSSIWNTSIPIYIPEADIEVLKQVSPTNTASTRFNTFPQTLNYTVKWINKGPNDVYGLNIYDFMFARNISCSAGSGFCGYELPYAITNQVWSANPGTTLPTSTFVNPSGSNFFAYNNVAILTPTIATWQSGDTITFTYSITFDSPVIVGCGGNINFEIANQATYNKPVGNISFDPNINNNTATTYNYFTYSGAPDCPPAAIDLKVESNFVVNNSSSGCTGFPILKTVTYKYINNSPVTVDSFGVYLVDNPTLSATNPANNSIINGSTFTVPWSISNITSTSSGLSNPLITTAIPNSGISTAGIYSTSGALNRSLLHYGHPFYVGDTLTLTYTITYQKPTAYNLTACGISINFGTYSQTNVFELENGPTETTPADNGANSSTTSTITPVDLVISKSVTPNLLENGDVANMETIFQNASNIAVVPAIIRDTLPATFILNESSFLCTPNTNGVCGTYTYNPTTRILEYTIPSMPANSQITLTYNGIISSTISQTDSTRAWAIAPCIDCVTSTNKGQSNFQLNSSLLPVELISFTGESKNCKSILTWKTGTEVNFNRFEIHRSFDNVKFDKLADINAKGSNSTYSFFENTRKKKVHYRLLMVDYDGKTKESNIITLNSTCEREGVYIYPNPTNDIVNVSFEYSSFIGKRINITSVDGKVIKDFAITQLNEVIDLSSYNAGIYMINIPGYNNFKVIKN